MLTALFL
jgi:hypothetical protein